MKSVWDEMQEEARAETAKTTREDVASTMLKDGELAMEKIAKYSGLSLVRVQEIAKALA